MGPTNNIDVRQTARTWQKYRHSSSPLDGRINILEMWESPPTPFVATIGGRRIRPRSAPSVDFANKVRQFGEQADAADTGGGSFTVVSMGVLEHGDHANFESRSDVEIDAVADKQDVVRRQADPLGGDAKDANVGLAEVELTGIKPDWKEVQKVELLKMLVEEPPSDEGVGDQAQGES